MPRIKSRKDCLFCGGVEGGITKEHIFQQTIGGVRWYRGVCQKCNNGVLSQLDAEFCTRSPLSLIAGPSIHGGLGWTWDVDHSSNDLLLEGRGDPGGGSMTIWPQMIFDREGMQFRADWELMVAHGVDRTTHTFIREMRSAVDRYKHTHRGVVFRRFPHEEDLLARYRYPPRIFVERHPHEFSDDMTFIVAYVTDNDRRRVLHAIDQWNGDSAFRGREVQRGSELPVVRNRWDHVLLVRALTKIGLNLLFDTTERTEVSNATFTGATQFVLTGRDVPLRFLRDCGFVWASDLDFMKHPEGGHAFRLVHDKGWWKVMLSFFGGKVAGFVQLPGPNYEKWDCVQGSTPLKSSSRDVTKDWKVTYPKVAFPIHLHLDWDPRKIIPSLDLQNSHQSLDIRRG